MFVFISIPYTQAVFDIIDTNPEDIEGISEKEYAVLEKEYTKKLDAQYMLEAHAWVNKYIKSEAIITWAQNSGSEDIEFQMQLD